MMREVVRRGITGGALIALFVLSAACGDRDSDLLPAPEVFSVRLVQDSVAMKVGETRQLDLQVGLINAPPTFRWTSRDTEVATVDTSGVVTGVGTGTTRVTVRSTFDTTKADSAAVLVHSPEFGPRGVFVSPAEFSVLVGDTVRLTAEARGYPRDSTSFVWSSSDPAVATVDSMGLVRGVSPDSVRLTAKLVRDSSKTATASGEVVPK